MEEKYVLKYFRELDTFSFSELKMDLMKASEKEISNEELLKIITILKNKRVIVQRRSKDERDSYKDDFDYSKINYEELDFTKVDPSKQQVFVIRYVGIIVIKNYVFKCLPKYISALTNTKQIGREKYDKLLKKIINVLKIYNSRQERLFSATNRTGDEEFDFLDMAVFFLNDYLENGVYYNEKNILEVNGDGEINWNETINDIDAILTDRGPVYVELFTESTESDDNDFFRRLHLYIIAYCTEILEAADLFDVLSIDNSFELFSDVDKYSLGDDEYILERIHKEIGIQFITRKLELLEKMYTFISRKNDLDKEYNVSLYGTSSFHVIWEEVCQDVLDNQLYVEMGHLPVQSKLDFSKLASIRYKIVNNDIRINRAISRLKEMQLNKLIEKPKWHVFNSNHQHESDKTYIPDLLQIYEKNGILHFNILDAKYRRFILDQQRLDNSPGVEEITKQYLYQLVLSDLFDSYTFEKNNIKITNSFLFPGEGEKAIILGMAEIKALKNIPLENILAIRLPADMMYDNYISNIKLKNIEDII